jgi:cytochrome bd ubiquinol oxidase subunit I
MGDNAKGCLGMNELFFYPPRDFGPLMSGIVIGGMGILHVFLAQFAIGGGMLMTYFEWLHGRGRSNDARLFLTGFFRLLVLVSFVLGAVTGVGMWLTSIQISPATIGLMVRTFHWVWAIEWTFFTLEVVSGYVFYRYGDRLPHRRRLQLLALYSFASWFSLFWINGILAWQLTPGRWLETHNVWAGFFNPSFWPSLLFRTVACMATAGLAAAAVINLMPISRERRHELLAISSRFLAPMLVMPVLAVWYLWVMPADSRSWVLGGSTVIAMLFGVGAASCALVAVYAIVAVFYGRLYVNGATALLLLALAFGATAGGEFVREGARKPFTVRQVLFSNAITPEAVAHYREVGSVRDDPYPLIESFANPQLELGARVYRLQCRVCHTLRGMNGIVHLTATWAPDQQRLNIAKLQQTKAFMPPFAGSPEELEALVQLLRWYAAEEPSSWPVSSDPVVLAGIRRHLDEAGTLATGPERLAPHVEGTP